MAIPANPTVEEIAKFWSQVDVRKSNECWPWKGRVNGDGRYTGGYGTLFLKNRGTVLAHRLAYEIAYGPTNILAHPDWVVGHLCMNFNHRIKRDNRRCCNPKHLDLTTRSSDKSRHSRIKKTPTKIPESEVVRILDLCLIQGKHYLDVMDGLNITTQTLWAIVRGNSHVRVWEQFLVDHGITVDQARIILKEASRKKKKVSRKKGVLVRIVE